MEEYIDINKIAEAKGLTSTRAIRLKIQRGQYIAREVTVQGGKSYEVLFESLEYDIQALVKESPEPFYYPARQKQTPREEQINRKIFASDYEKYEWLMKNGCTNSDDRHWLTNYIRSDEYNNIYGD